MKKLITIALVATMTGAYAQKADSTKADTSFIIGHQEAVNLYIAINAAEEALQHTSSHKLTVDDANNTLLFLERIKQKIISKYVPQTAKK